MTYTNPVVRGIAPDPSAIRVGNDYYLANSTFDLLPGIVIRHSTDLVTWRIVGHAVTRPSQYRRDGQPGPVALFAPTLRHHDGTFYLATTNAVDGQGNFMVTTRDVTGDWSDATWIDHDGFDPSLFRDGDGTWYYTRRTLQFGPDGNLGPIVQAVIDINTGSLEPLQAITPPHGYASNDIEGPHLYKRGAWYYLCSAEAGSWTGHMQTIARSTSPWGPFEAAPNTPMLTHRHLTANPIQCLGHAELVDAADGSSWALTLGTRPARMAQHHTLGRETFLTPVTWVDDWPLVGVRRDGTTSLIIDAPTPEPQEGAGHQVPDSLWARRWSTLRAPHADLNPNQVDPIQLPAGIDLRDNASNVGPVGALLHPQTEYGQRFTATVTDHRDGTVAGIAAYTDPTHCYSLTIDGRGNHRTVTLTRTVDDLTTTSQEPLLGTGDVTLSIDGQDVAYRFTARADGHDVDLGSGSARLLSAQAAQWWVGVHWALLALGDNGAVTFADVAITDIDPGPPASPVPW